jgi:DNA replication protein DnaC
MAMFVVHNIINNVKGEFIMSIQTTLEQLRTLKVHGMIKAFEEQIAQPNTYLDLSMEERFAMIVDREVIDRQNKKVKRLVAQAKFKIQAMPHDIDYQHPRELSKENIASLLNGEWINRHQNLLITGPTGCGKSYIACALGYHACQQGISVKYFRSTRFFESLLIAHGDGSYAKLIKDLAKIRLLIIDDWGIDQLAPISRTDFFEIMEDRHNHSATLITSQIPSIHWHETIGDPTLADAILDRLLHNAHRIKLSGESMRKTKNNLTDADQLG